MQGRRGPLLHGPSHEHPHGREVLERVAPACCDYTDAAAAAAVSNNAIVVALLLLGVHATHRRCCRRHGHEQPVSGSRSAISGRHLVHAIQAAAAAATRCGHSTSLLASIECRHGCNHSCRSDHSAEYFH